MGYITTVLTAEERRRGGSQERRAGDRHRRVRSARRGHACTPLRHRKGKATAPCWHKLLPTRSGLQPTDIRTVSEIDTARDAWSIASGNYSSRFAAAVGGAAHLAATRLKEKLARTAAAQLNVPPAEIEFAGGRVRARGNPDNSIPFARLAATSHWSPGMVADDNQALRETVFWTPPELTAPTEDDEINSSLCHGFIFDFCGVEVDRVTGAVRIDKYVTMHDCGRVLHPGMVAGQVTGGFAQAIGAALYEEYRLLAGRRFSRRDLRRLSAANDH